MSKKISCFTCNADIDVNSKYCTNCGALVHNYLPPRKFRPSLFSVAISGVRRSIEKQFSSLFVIFIVYIIIVSVLSLLLNEFLIRAHIETLIVFLIWMIFFKLITSFFQVPIMYKDLKKEGSSIIEKIKVVATDFVISIPTFNSPVLAPIYFIVGVGLINEFLFAFIGPNYLLDQFKFLFYFILIFVSIYISIRLAIIVPSMIDQKISVSEASNLTKRELFGIFIYMVFGNFGVISLGYFAFIAGFYFSFIFSISNSYSPNPGYVYYSPLTLPMFIIIGSFFFVVQLIDYFGRNAIYRYLTESKR